MRRAGLALGIALIGSMPLVAACSGGADDSAGARPSEAVPSEFAGTIRLGAALSETGKYSVEGRDSRQGYDTWLRWVNDVYGGISFDERGVNVRKSMGMVQVLDGEIVVVAPDDAATAPLRYPRAQAAGPGASHPGP